MVAAIFTAVYMFVPNTRVKWKPALIGGVAAGILWAAVGQVVHRARGLLHAAHRGVRRLRHHRRGAAVDLLRLADPAGRRAAVVLRAEPQLPALGLTELRLSAVQREQLTLKVMFLIAPRLPRRQDALDGGQAGARARHARHRHLAHRATRSKTRISSRSPTMNTCCRRATSARSRSRKSSTSRAMKRPARWRGAISRYRRWTPSARRWTRPGARAAAR